MSAMTRPIGCAFVVAMQKNRISDFDAAFYLRFVVTGNNGPIMEPLSLATPSKGYGLSWAWRHCALPIVTPMAPHNWDICMIDSINSGPPVGKRKRRRRRVLFSGFIYVPETHSPFNCSIKDVSETGAKIIIKTEALVPSTFQLVNVTNQTAFEVQCVRRSGRELGLKILRSISLTEAASSDAQELKRLLVAWLHRYACA